MLNILYFFVFFLYLIFKATRLNFEKQHPSNSELHFIVDKVIKGEHWRASNIMFLSEMLS